MGTHTDSFTLTEIGTVGFASQGINHMHIEIINLLMKKILRFK